MATGYYLQDNPNPNTPQYGWPRARLDQPGQHLSGVIGVHTSEAPTDFEGPDFNAENNAAFVGRRTDYGSYHTTADADSIVPLVHPAWAAWADTTNNAHALSVSGCLEAARWLEMTPERRRQVVVNMGHAAAQMVLVAVADGYLGAPTPAVRISPEEAISGSRPGFYGHGETNPGTRYDPGAHFDWELFLSSYAQAIEGIEDDMGHVDSISPEAAEAIADALLSRDVQREGAPAGDTNRLAWSLGAESGRTNGIIARTAEAAVRGVLFTKFPRQGAGQSGETDLASVISWFDSGLQSVGGTHGDAAAALPIDPESVKVAISAAVADALKDLTVTLSTEEPGNG
jgi:hypothetical protein